MPAYIIANIELTDPDKYEDYKALSPAAIAAYGGKFLVRGGKKETLEGETETRRVVIIEFPDYDAAKTFYDSPEYLKARAAREGAANSQLVLVDGL